MKKNTKKRLLETLDILRRHSDEKHHLPLSAICELLGEEYDRKTFYDDVKVLNSHGYNIEYANDGYYLLEAPFSLCEIKILSDSLNTLHSLDPRLAKELKAKLYSFISIYDEAFLERIAYQKKQQASHFLYSLEDVLWAIQENRSVRITRNNGKQDEVFPLFLYREKDYYYFYYHYPQNRKIYHFRFDSLKEVIIGEAKDELTIPQNEILKVINTSSSAYHIGNCQTVSFKINQKNLEKYLKDDFPGLILTKDGFAVESDINPQFFAHIAAYGDGLTITSPDVAEAYKDYLKNILANYR